MLFRLDSGVCVYVYVDEVKPPLSLGMVWETFCPHHCTLEKQFKEIQAGEFHLCK